MKTYHIALIKADEKTLQLQAEENKDSLSADVLEYLGEYETTRQKLVSNTKRLLAHLQSTKPAAYSNFKRIFVA